MRIDDDHVYGAMKLVLTAHLGCLHTSTFEILFYCRSSGKIDELPIKHGDGPLPCLYSTVDGRIPASPKGWS